MGITVLAKPTAFQSKNYMGIDQIIPNCYNYTIMKPIQFTLPPIKERRHRALFDQDLPFRGRVEQPKTVYKRNPKHKTQYHIG